MIILFIACLTYSYFSNIIWETGEIHSIASTVNPLRRRWARRMPGRCSHTTAMLCQAPSTPGRPRPADRPVPQSRPVSTSARVLGRDTSTMRLMLSTSTWSTVEVQVQMQVQVQVRVHVQVQVWRRSSQHFCHGFTFDWSNDFQLKTVCRPLHFAEFGLLNNSGISWPFVTISFAVCIAFSSGIMLSLFLIWSCSPK